VPDERWGEVCSAFVVLRDGASASEQELREHCGERLARFKVPTTFRFVEELPRSSMGKVQKDVLRASALEVPR
jgi:fatty-acyl-CoA synthase